MNAFQLNIFLAFASVIDLTLAISVKGPKMTWADVFKDRLQIKNDNRQRRSQMSTKKSFVLSHGFEADGDQGQYSLQYIDQYGDGRDQSKENLFTTHDYNYITVKDSSIFDKERNGLKEKLQSAVLKTPLSYIYTEAEQPAQFVTESYKFVTVPQVNLHQSTEGDHYYHKLQDYDNSDSYASKYKFGYRVSDPHSGAEFGHSEVSEGHVKKGHYHVLLPDGRLQNVKYWAGPSGYHATVTYEGHGYHYPTYQ